MSKHTNLENAITGLEGAIKQCLIQGQWIPHNKAVGQVGQGELVVTLKQIEGRHFPYRLTIFPSGPEGNIIYAVVHFSVDGRYCLMPEALNKATIEVKLSPTLVGSAYE